MIQIIRKEQKYCRRIEKGGVFYDYILCGNRNTEAA